MKGDLPRTQWLAENAGPRTNGITGDSQAARYTIMRGSAEREEVSKREKCGRQEAAGLRSRVPRRKRKPLLRAKREAERKRERKEGRERETEKRLTACGSQAVPVLCRPYVKRKDRMVQAQRKREDEV